MCGIPGNINTTHPRLNEVAMSLVLIGDRHDINEGIILERAAFDAVKNGQTVTHGQCQSAYKFPKSM